MGSVAIDPPDIELRPYGAINEKCRELKSYPLALGGIDDHLHLLVRLPTTLSVADLLKGVKGSSSHLLTHEVAPDKFFKWQGAYGAFTLAKQDVDRVIDYIRNQKTHHVAKTIWDEWERCEIQDTDEDWDYRGSS